MSGEFYARHVSFTRDGTTLEVDEDAYLLMHGLQVGPTAPEYQTTRYPVHDGGQVRGVMLGLGEPFVPLAVQGTSSAELRTRLQTLERLLDPKQGPVVLTVAQPDGERRDITGYAKVERGDYDIDYQMLGVTFTCPDPYWYGTLVSYPFGSGVTKTFLSSGGSFFPFQLTPDAILGSTTMDNIGDADTYSTWRFDGPFDSITVTNNTTGKSFTITGTVTAGHYLTVDTTPWVQTIVDDLGVNRFAWLSTDSSLFALLPGVNSLTFALTGTTAVSAATATHRPRFRAA